MIHTRTSYQQRDAAAILVLPFCEHAPICKSALYHCHATETPIRFGDFHGKEGEIALVYEGDERIILLGLGKEPKAKSVRKCYATLCRFAKKHKWKKLSLLLPEGFAKAAAEGLVFANYAFDKHKKEKESVLEQIFLIDASSEEERQVERALQIGRGMDLTRDLVNGSADDITPVFLGDVAQKLAREHATVTTTRLDKAEIEAEKMGLLLAVSQGSACDPCFIVCEYKGRPDSNDKSVIIGKGVTFDTGGLNLKPTGSMETMRADMAGAAAALGIIKAAAEMQLKANVTVVIAATENAIDGRSYKPGDVYVAMDGTTVEITNTDAEGRLTLADALVYSELKLAPTRIIDMATLTGAIEIALGDVRAGLFCNDTALEKALMSSGERTGERLWPFPLDSEYREYLKSNIADIKNAKKRMAGAITGAIFLQEFVKKTPWAHLDIAGTAFLSEGTFFGTTPASAFGVGLIIDLLEQLNGGSP